jgi:hypothetical protein
MTGNVPWSAAEGEEAFLFFFAKHGTKIDDHTRTLVSTNIRTQLYLYKYI